MYHVSQNGRIDLRQSNLFRLELYQHCIVPSPTAPGCQSCPGSGQRGEISPKYIFHVLLYVVYKILTEQISTVEQIILRELERIINKCGGSNGLLCSEQEISCHLDTLTALTHFTTYMVAAEVGARSAITKQLHFRSSLVRYVMWGVDKSLLHSHQPELLWKHAASVGAITELLALMKIDPVGLGESGHAVQIQDQKNYGRLVFDIANRLLRGDLEMCYILGMCTLDSPFLLLRVTPYET